MPIGMPPSLPLPITERCQDLAECASGKSPFHVPDKHLFDPKYKEGKGNKGVPPAVPVASSSFSSGAATLGNGHAMPRRTDVEVAAACEYRAPLHVRRAIAGSITSVSKVGRSDVMRGMKGEVDAKVAEIRRCLEMVLVSVTGDFSQVQKVVEAVGGGSIAVYRERLVEALNDISFKDHREVGKLARALNLDVKFTGNWWHDRAGFVDEVLKRIEVAEGELERLGLSSPLVREYIDGTFDEMGGARNAVRIAVLRVAEIPELTRGLLENVRGCGEKKIKPWEYRETVTALEEELAGHERFLKKGLGANMRAERSGRQERGMAIEEDRKEFKKLLRRIRSDRMEKFFKNRKHVGALGGDNERLDDLLRKKRALLLKLSKVDRRDADVVASRAMKKRRHFEELDEAKGKPADLNERDVERIIDGEFQSPWEFMDPENSSFWDEYDPHEVRRFLKSCSAFSGDGGRFITGILDGSEAVLEDDRRRIMCDFFGDCWEGIFDGRVVPPYVPGSEHEVVLEASERIANTGDVAARGGQNYVFDKKGRKKYFRKDGTEIEMHSRQVPNPPRAVRADNKIRSSRLDSSIALKFARDILRRAGMARHG